MSSLYRLKPQFQQFLRPVASGLAGAGVTANAVTVTETAVSALLGAVLALNADRPGIFLLLPLWLFVRMAANALDGLLAREHGSGSRLGVYLNELCDVVGDAALYLPFVAVAPFGWPGVGAVVLLSALAEMAGALGPAAGGRRRYEGPLGKSDRALAFGALALWYGLAGSIPDWASWIMPLLAVGLVATIVNRVRAGLA
jgi:CDP-diacylglycerol--glycerol-3-phosphate 3-phosphatidyltransferase